MRIVVSITCAAHIPERKAALDRTVKLLAKQGAQIAHLETGKASPGKWSREMWSGGLANGIAMGATHVMMLTEDLILCPDFWRHANAAVEARPDDLVSLHPWSPYAKKAVEMKLSWIATYDGLIGTAWVIPIDMLRELIAWRDDAMLPEAYDYPEDATASLFCMATDRLIHHTVPGLVVHDQSMASLYGHDNDGQRHPSVTFMDVDPGTVDWHTNTLFAGRVYRGTAWAGLTHLKPEARVRYNMGKKVYRVMRSVASEV